MTKTVTKTVTKAAKKPKKKARNTRPRGVQPKSRTDKQIIDALNDAGGLILRAARALGCQRGTIYERAAKSPAIMKAINQARMGVVDDAEQAITDQIAKGDTTAIIFALKCLGRTRGWQEKQVIEATVDTKNKADDMAAALGLPVNGATGGVD